MIKTLTIDIINDKAVRLIQDMEHLKLIRVRKEKNKKSEMIDWAAEYKGAMERQSLNDIDNQLNELRSSWE
jgi:hypothetical protein